MARARNELKYFINLGDYYSITKKLKNIAQKDRFSNKDGRYEIRSIYFDNIYDKALNEKIGGYNRREKFRIRFYNDNFSFIKLEKKSKINGKCIKHFAPITKEECDKILNNDISWMISSKEGLIQELYFKMKSQLLKPRTIVDYTREAYIYKSGNVRITIDTNVKTGIYSKDFFNMKLPKVRTISNDLIILEVKYDNFFPDVIKNLVQTNTRRATSISKYANCRMFG